MLLLTSHINIFQVFKNRKCLDDIELDFDIGVDFIYVLLFVFQVFKDRKWLGNISYLEGRMTFREPQVVAKGPLPNTQKVSSSLLIPALTHQSSSSQKH